MTGEAVTGAEPCASLDAENLPLAFQYCVGLSKTQNKHFLE